MRIPNLLAFISIVFFISLKSFGFSFIGWGIYRDMAPDFYDSELMRLVKNSDYKFLKAEFDFHESAIKNPDNSPDLVKKYKERLEQLRFQINQINNDGMRPIHVAAFNNDVNILKLLIDQGADLHYTLPTSKENIVHFAAFNGSLEALKFLKRKNVNFNQLSVRGHLAYHYSGSVEVAKYFIDELGTPLEISSVETKQRLVHIAAFRGFDDMVQFYYKRGGDIEARDWLEQTPLHAAAHGISLDVVLKLRELNADMLARDYLGNTILHISFYYGDHQLKFYLDLGIHPDLRDNKGEPPRSIAGESLIQYAMDLENKSFLYELLVKYKADPNVVDYRSRRYPLHEACKRRDYDLIKFFLDYGAKPFSVDLAGNFCLDYTNDPKVSKIFNSHKSTVRDLKKIYSNKNLENEKRELKQSSQKRIREERNSLSN